MKLLKNFKIKSKKEVNPAVNDNKSMDSNIIKEFIILPIILCILLAVVGGIGIHYAKVSDDNFKKIKKESFTPLLAIGEVSNGLNRLADKLGEGRSHDSTVKYISGKLSYLLIYGDDPQVKTTLKEWRKLKRDLKEKPVKNVKKALSKIKTMKNHILLMKVMINENLNILLTESSSNGDRSVLYSLLILVLGLILGVLSSARIIKKIYELYRVIERGNNARRTLLNNLDTGFMVFSKDGVIQDECTAITSTFFGVDPKGKKFHELLQCDDKASKFMEDWYQMAFSKEYDFTDVSPIAPQSFEKNERFISLDYKTIESPKGNTDYVICIASDQTEIRNLREESIKESSMVQMVMLINKDRNAFMDFISQNKKLFSEIRMELNKENQNIDIDSLFRNIHSIKGMSASFFVNEINSLAHEFENDLSNMRTEQHEGIKISVNKLQEKIGIIESTFEQFLKKNEDLIGNVTEIKDQRVSLSLSKIEKISNYIRNSSGSESELYQNYVNELLLENFHPLFRRYENIVKEIAKTRNKRVDVEIIDSEVKVYKRPYRKLVTSFVHAFRNAVDHGIEYPHERLEKGKKEHGTITITVMEVSYPNAVSRIRIIIEDDGKGVDPNMILNKAIEKGLIKQDDISKMNEKDMLQLVFKPNFSTRDEVTSLSGRGVGMDAILYEAKKIGGTAWFESSMGVGSKINIEVPKYTTPIFRASGSKRFYHNTTETPIDPSLVLPNEGGDPPPLPPKKNG